MRSSDRSAIGVTVAVLLSAPVLRPLTEDTSYLGVSWLLIGLIGLIGALARRTPLGSIGALLGQLAALLVAGYLLISGAPAAPALGPIENLRLLVTDAAGHMQTQAAPMEPNDGVKLLLVCSLGGIAILTDLLVITLAKPALGLAPPLAVFLVPAIGLGIDTGWRAFLCVALGYLAILTAEGLNRNARWTRGLSSDTAAGPSAEAGVVVWRAAGVIAVPALVLTLVAAAATPTVALGNWGFGDAGGSSGGPLRLSDPTLDLRRNLTQPTDQVVLNYRTNKEGGTYLRLASLPAFSDAGWQNTQTSIQSGDRLPPPSGLTESTGRPRQTTIEIENLSSEYLPLPFVPTSYSAPGEWGYDPTSLVVISSDRSGDRGEATQGLRYSATSRDVTPNAERLTGSVAGSPPDSEVTTEVPEDLPDRIRNLAEEVTAGADNPAAQAAAIQSYLRSPENFTYSTDPRPGTGYQALTNFLFSDRQGYCEQFAATMAIMARVVGIPSRVAVGFLPGEQDGDTWTVTARDAHAWPELYFSGYGWVRYEPTPSRQTGSAPSWTLAQESEPTDTPSIDIDPQAPTAPAQPSTGPGQQGGGQNQPTRTPTAGPPLGRIFGISGAVLAGLAALAAPGVLRWNRRRLRLGGTFSNPADRVEAGWAEIRDTVRDLRRRWPADSPRSIATQLGRDLDPGARDALGRLSLLVERERYGRDFTDTAAAAEVAGLVTTVRTALLADRRLSSRVAVTVLPRSLFRRG